MTWTGIPPPVPTCSSGRLLSHHPRSTSVAVIHLDRTCLITGDGLATVLQWDFWTTGPRLATAVLEDRNTVQDPLYISDRQRVGQN